MALVAEDNTPFSKEVPLTTSTKTEDTILEALKEGEIEMLECLEKGQKQSIIVQVVRRSQNLRRRWPRASQIRRPYTLLEQRNGGSSQTE